MRLIDADKLIDDITKTINEWIGDMSDGEYLKGNVNFSVMARELIESQPTAYDVDKVVKELEELLTINMEVLGVRADYVNLAHVIKIVKRGGIDEN